MAWGIVEDYKTPRPPGTVLLDDIRKEQPDADNPEFQHLKKDGEIILQPQPSDSVNDPLNWSMKLKVGILLTMFVTMTTIGGLLSMLGTGKRILAEKYHVKFPVVVKYLSPPGIISNAISIFFASAISIVWGKRIGIVIGVFMIWINMFCGQFANSLSYYRNLSIVNGIGGAPAELLLSPMIADVMFVHQRARLMSFSAFIHVIGGDAAHVISGNIIEKLGIKYLYIVTFSVMSPLVFAVYFFVRETTYYRAPPKEASLRVTSGDFEAGSSKKGDDFGSDEKKSTIIVTEDIKELSRTSTSSSEMPRVDLALEPKHTLRQNLRIYRGRVSDRSFFVALFQPFPMLLFPSVTFSTVINGAFTTWAMISGIIMNQVLLYPPYNLKPATMAYIGLPGSVVGLVSALCAGFLSDWLITFMAKRNKGVYEPEYRLILMIPAVFFSTLGFIMLGPAFARHDSVIKIVVMGLCFHVAGPFAHSACVTYVFDTMGNNSTEAFVASSLAKHVFMWACTNYVPTWFAQAGPVHCYRTLAILNISFAALGVPMYIFGKRLRGAVSRNKFLGAMIQHRKSPTVGASH